MEMTESFFCIITLLYFVVGKKEPFYLFNRVLELLISKGNR